MIVVKRRKAPAAPAVDGWMCVTGIPLECPTPPFSLPFRMAPPTAPQHSPAPRWGRGVGWDRCGSGVEGAWPAAPRREVRGGEKLDAAVQEEGGGWSCVFCVHTRERVQCSSKMCVLRRAIPSAQVAGVSSRTGHTGTHRQTHTPKRKLPWRRKAEERERGCVSASECVDRQLRRPSLLSSSSSALPTAPDIAPGNTTSALKATAMVISMVGSALLLGAMSPMANGKSILTAQRSIYCEGRL